MLENHFLSLSFHLLESNRIFASAPLARSIKMPAVVYFKFKSSKETDSLQFHGERLSLKALKEGIMLKKMSAKSSIAKPKESFDLKVFDAQTNEGKPFFPRLTRLLFVYLFVCLF
jgi:hypothetical protein